MAPTDFTQMSNEQLMEIAGITPKPTVVPDAASNPYSSMSNEQLMQIAGITPERTMGDTFTNWGQSFARGLGSLGDAAQGGAAAMMPGGNILKALAQMYSPQTNVEKVTDLVGAPDYSKAGFPERAVGAMAEALPFSFMGGVGPTMMSALGGETTNSFGLGRLSGEILGGGIPSLLKMGKRYVVRPGADEIKSSAALAQKELTGITSDTLESAIQKAPQDDLGRLMSTAEITDNAGFAQIEKDLGSKVGPFSNAYNAKALDREVARNKILEALIPEKAPVMETEALGTEVIKKGLSTKQVLDKAEKTAWNLIPRNQEIAIQSENKILNRILSRKQAGLPLDREVRLLTDQFKANGSGVASSGALQDIRSSALEVLRTKDLDGYSRSVAANLADLTDRALRKGLSQTDYPLYKSARDITRNKAELFNQTSAGGSIINPATQAQNVLSNALKGDRRSVQEFRKAIGNDETLIDATKRWVVDNVPRDAKGQLTSSGLNRFLNNKAGQLKELYGENHYNRMKRIVEDLRSQDTVLQKAYRSSGQNSPTAPRQTVASGIKDLVLDSVPGGRVVGRLSSAVGKSSGRANEAIAEQINEWLFKASLDPKIALELSKTSTANRVKGVWDLLKESGRDSLLQGIRSKYQTNAIEPTQSEQSKLMSTEQDLAKSLNLSNELAGSANQERTSKNQLLQPSTYTPNDLISSSTSTQGSTTPKVLLSSKRQQSLENTQRATSPNPVSFSDPNQVKDFVSQQHPLIQAVIRTESGGKANAKSPVGAQGLMQLMPGTAKQLGVSNAFNPEENVKGGTQYLIQMLDMFGDTRLALGAYNAGPGRMERAIKGTIKAGEKVNWYNVSKRLPQETRDYVPKVIGNYQRLIRT